MTSVLSRRAIFALAGLACLAWTGAATAASMSFKVPLSGAQQVPPVKTKGKGTAKLTWNPTTHVVTWRISYSHMSSAVIMAHFHDGAKGKNGKVEIWLTKKGMAVKSPIKGKATLSAAQAKDLEAGMWYINVHTKKHPPGEIRGQVILPKKS